MRRRSKRTRLTLQDIKNQWIKQKGKCVYSNVRLKLQHIYNKRRIKQYYQASIDRIDSNKGYTKENIQILSITCNRAKNDMAHREMVEFIKIIKKNAR